MTPGRLAGLTTWPVKSMAGGTHLPAVYADGSGLAGDRRYALRDLRSSAGDPLSARSVPGLLRWTGSRGPVEPLVTGPDGRSWSWSEAGLAEALTDDLGTPVALQQVPGGAQDLGRSVLVTTAASHREVERRYGHRLEPARWRTNLHLDLPEPAFAEHSWEGRRLLIGEVVLRLLHPCRRCTIPTYAPGGLARQPELLRFFATGGNAGPFGINARVEVPGVLTRGTAVRLD